MGSIITSMDKLNQFDEPDFTYVITYSKKFIGNDFSLGLNQIKKTAFLDYRNLPNLGYPSKIRKGKLRIIPLKKYIENLTTKNLKGYKSRPSIKDGQKSKTFSDPTIEVLLIAKSKKLTNVDVTKIADGHKLLMTSENLLGNFLEEYLSLYLLKFGWNYCWGSSIDAVDVCHEDCRLLHVKNSDNSENSSSKRIRNRTTIIKWARRISTKHNSFRWNYLIEETGADTILECDFREFVSITVEENPKGIYTSIKSRFN